jgi:hypothetical protein
MRAIHLLMLSLPVILVSGNVSAQAWQNRTDRGEDRREVRQTVREMQDDLRDLRTLQDLLSRFDAARARKNRAALSRIEVELREHLREELAENRHELAKDKAEVRQAQRELESSRREAAQVGWHRPGERADLRDELRDDRRDLAREQRRLQERQRIAQELRKLEGRQDPRSLDHMRSLLVQLIGLAQSEVVENRKEIREDRRETREDRRDPRHWH